MDIFLEVIDLLLAIALIYNLMCIYKKNTGKEKKCRLTFWFVVFAFILLLTPCFLLVVDLQ